MINLIALMCKSLECGHAVGIRKKDAIGI